MATPSSSGCLENNNALLAAQNNEAVESTSKVDDSSVKTLNTNRVQGDQNLNPRIGTTCHQCRQKTQNFAALCTNIKKKGAICPIKYCHRCLSNRYGETAEEVQRQGNWICPKCRGNCNCSVCRKAKGYEPTGQLAPAAKAKGFNSVYEMLQVKGPEKSGLDKDVEGKGASSKKPAASDKEATSVLPKKRGKENSSGGSVDLELNATLDSEELEIKRMKREGLVEIGNGSMEDGAAVNDNAAKAKCKGKGKGKSKAIKAPHKALECSTNKRKKEVDLELPLPQGNLLQAVAGVEVAPQEVGDALQFLRFFETFEQILKFKKSEAESVLRELRRGSGRSGRPGQYSSVIRVHTHLLSFIKRVTVEESSSSEQTSYNTSWFQDLLERIAESCDSEFDQVLKELLQVCRSSGMEGYDILSFSQKLRILNFLCDEALSTKHMRSWMDKQAEMSVERQKEARVRVAAAKKKEKHLKKKLQDEKKTQENAEPASVSEQEAIVSQIQSEADQAQEELVEATAKLPKGEQISDAIRTGPYLSDTDGRIFWKLKGHSSEGDVLLQDLGTWDESPFEDKWFGYGADVKEPLQKYLSAQRLKTKRARREEKLAQKTPCEDNEGNVEELSEEQSSEDNMVELSPSETNKDTMQLGPPRRE